MAYNYNPVASPLIQSQVWQNPADDAMKYLNQIASTITPYYQPYIDTGIQAMNVLMPQLMSLVSNPVDLMNMIGGQYQASPGYQYNVQQATNAANQAAAAGGMVGSPAEQQELSQQITGMASQDFYDFLDRALKVYGGGMQGLGGATKMGYQASSSLAEDLASALLSQARMQYAGTMSQNQANQGFLGDMTKAVTSLF